MPKLNIDGVEIEGQDGQTVLQVALEHGIHIPHLCYHPRLEIAGNCRMCLVEIEKIPKLQIACGTQVREGMVVSTKSDKVVQARKAVLEFLLINHPLDCPVCDQCGECKVQDYCFQYGQERSRYQEGKRTYARMSVGENIVRDMNRCIHCTRCIRFLREVAGLEEFTLYERGGRTQVGPYLDLPIQTPFSLNLSEVCPVGALTSKHFRFKGRSWLMLKTRTLCAGCSRGCNVFAWSSKGKVLRLSPAENQMVNLCWLCDPGRLSIARVHDNDRVLAPTLDGQPVDMQLALDRVASGLKNFIDAGQAGQVGVVASSKLTNEDIYMIRKLAREVIGTSRITWTPEVKDDRPFGPLETPLSEWFIRKDQTPNSRGARDILESTAHEQDIESLIETVERGEIKALLVFSEELTSLLDKQRVIQAMGKLDLLWVVDTHWTETAKLAKVVLPEASFIEKDGTFTNQAGRVQRLRAAINLMGQGRSTWETVQKLAGLLGAVWHFASAGEVMEEIAAKVNGYADIGYADLTSESAVETS